MRNRVVFYLNGQRQEVGADQARMMLSDYLRYEKSLTGTKVVCAEGDCGACSILKLDSKNQYIPLNSCISTVSQMDGSSIVTVDALSSTSAQGTPVLSPVQSAMVNCHGSQCGFCTPGFVVTLTGAIEKKICQKKSASSNASTLSVQEAKNALTGNLCRCTGYQSILDAATSVKFTECEPVRKRFFSKSQEQDLKKVRAAPLHLEADDFSIFAPLTLKNAVNYLSKNKDARLIGGSTDLGVLSNKGKLRFEKLLSLHLISEMHEIKKTKTGRISVGARVNLSELRNFIKPLVPEFANFLDLFASPQIKNAATLVGNVGNASPIADTPPFLLVSQASVQLSGPKGSRSVPIEKFFLSYRRTALQPGEFIRSIEFDVPKKDEILALYKTSQRKDLDISIVNAAFHLKWKPGKPSIPKEISEIRIAMGGVAATPLRLLKTESWLKNRTLEDSVIQKAIETLHAEMNPISDLRGTSSYRRVVVENLFKKFLRELG